jgi:hypothetical protein
MGLCEHLEASYVLLDADLDLLGGIILDSAPPPNIMGGGWRSWGRGGRRGEGLGGKIIPSREDFRGRESCTCLRSILFSMLSGDGNFRAWRAPGEGWFGPGDEKASMLRPPLMSDVFFWRDCA